MRNKGVKPEDDDVPMSEKLDKIESVPIFRGTPDQCMDDVDDIVTWLQNGKDDSDDPTGQFKKIDQMLPKPKRGQKAEDRAREIEGVVFIVNPSGGDWKNCSTTCLASRMLCIGCATRV